MKIIRILEARFKTQESVLQTACPWFISQSTKEFLVLVEHSWLRVFYTLFYATFAFEVQSFKTAE